MRGREKRKGIETTGPNQFIHVDTTFHSLPDSTKMAAVFVSDNFSRHILGHGAAAAHGFRLTGEALTMAVQTIRQHHPAQEHTVMVTDGGGEHTAKGMADLLASIAPPHILQLIALRDIAFSNSPIEAVNRTFKRYLRHWQPQTPSQFIQCVERFVQDYACVRPHGSLDGLTPFEAYTGHRAVPPSPAALAQARDERRRANLAAGCGKCA
jgi:transposase InsO family protein